MMKKVHDNILLVGVIEEEERKRKEKERGANLNKEYEIDRKTPIDEKNFDYKPEDYLKETLPQFTLKNLKNTKKDSDGIDPLGYPMLDYEEAVGYG